MEGIAITIFEAMAMGVVPVGADVGGQQELVTPDCGVLIRPGTPQEQAGAYADALEKLIQSPETRATKGAAARERVASRFTIEQMGERMDHLMLEARQARRTRPGPAPLPGFEIECAVQAIEYNRLSRAFERLWKYEAVERVARRLGGRAAKLRHRWWILSLPLRKIKDAVWIAGHRAKLRLFHRDRESNG